MTSSFSSSFCFRVLWVVYDRNPSQIYLGRRGKFLGSPTRKVRLARQLAQVEQVSQMVSLSLVASLDGKIVTLDCHRTTSSLGQEITEVSNWNSNSLPGSGSKNSREESDWPGLYQVPISDLMVVAKRLNPVLELTWFRISSHIILARKVGAITWLEQGHGHGAEPRMEGSCYSGEPQ